MCEQCDPQYHEFRSGMETSLCDVCNRPAGDHRVRIRIGIPVNCCPSCGSSYFEADTGYCQMCRTHDGTSRKVCVCCGRRNDEVASYCRTCRDCDGDCVTVENIRGID